MNAASEPSPDFSDAFGPPPEPEPGAAPRRPDAPGPDVRGLALLHGAASIGRFDAVERLVECAREAGVPELRLEETLLQVAVFGGHPRAIQALGILARARPAPRSATRLREVGALSAGARAAAGRASWDAIYAEHAEAVIATLDGLVDGFSGWVLEDAYGRVLARPGLSLGERELLAVAALALIPLPAPLAAHVRGAMRNGSEAGDVEDILAAVRVLADERAMVVIDRTIGHLLRPPYRP